LFQDQSLMQDPGLSCLLLYLQGGSVCRAASD
uniref:Uncharacterized protein n=1 Tax=Amphimedon queenslandica TaxID=400682 RepID=A0A1X7VAE5_AMPQE